MWRSSLLKCNPVKVASRVFDQSDSFKISVHKLEKTGICDQNIEHMSLGFDQNTLFSQVKLFTSFGDKMIFPLTNFERHINKGVHFVSAAEKEQNHVGMPSCLIMANTSFFACFQYGGDPLRFLKTRNTSSCFTKLSMKSDDKTSHAVIFSPGLYISVLQVKPCLKFVLFATFST